MIKQLKVAIIFFICMSFILSGEESFVLPDILKAQHMDVNGNFLYIADNNKVFIYSIKDSKFIKTFGKRGEGPGEFMFEPEFSIISDSLLFEDKRNKILYFTIDGKFISETKIPAVARKITPIKDGFIGIKRIIDRKADDYIWQLVLFDKTFKTKKIIDKYSEKKRATSGKKMVINLLKHRFEVSVSDNRIYVGKTINGLFINVYDFSGKKLYSISKKYKKRSAGDIFMKGFIEKQKEQRTWEKSKNLFKVNCPEYYPAFQFLRVFENRIYLLTFPDEVEGSVRDIIVLNLKGDFIKTQKTDIGFPWCIKNHKVYSLITNSDENTQLSVISLK